MNDARDHPLYKAGFETFKTVEGAEWTYILGRDYNWNSLYGIRRKIALGYISYIAIAANIKEESKLEAVMILLEAAIRKWTKKKKDFTRDDASHSSGVVHA